MKICIFHMMHGDEDDDGEDEPTMMTISFFVHLGEVAPLHYGSEFWSTSLIVIVARFQWMKSLYLGLPRIFCATFFSIVCVFV